MTDIRAIKSKVINGTDPIKTLILSLPDDIPKEDLVSKMDLILKILDNEKAKNSNV